MATSASASLLTSSVGRKIAMALSGLLIVGWLFVHMVGNLLVFAGPEAINEYGEFIQHGTHGAVWPMRAVLLAALVVHVTAATLLVRQGAMARPVAYQGGRKNVATTAGARSMRYGGVALLLFAVYHLMHMTVGNAHDEFVRGDVYHNLVTAFADPMIVAIYLLAQLFLGLHLYHGVWSGMQTLGLEHGAWSGWRRPFSVGTAILIAGGFSVVPIAILAGIVH